MFDHGSFYSDSNSSLGRDTSPGEHSVQSLHVQDRGVFELNSFDKKLISQLSLTNLTVKKIFYLFIISQITTRTVIGQFTVRRSKI